MFIYIKSIWLITIYLFILSISIKYIWYFFYFSIAYNLAIILFALKASDIRILISYKSHMKNFNNYLFGIGWIKL